VAPTAGALVIVPPGFFTKADNLDDKSVFSEGFSALLLCALPPFLLKKAVRSGSSSFKLVFLYSPTGPFTALYYAHLPSRADFATFHHPFASLA
jgi:hypothetical protein